MHGVFLLFCPVLLGHKQGGATPGSQTSESAFLGGPNEIPVSDERTNPWGGISLGGAEKAEREQVQGAVEAQRAQRTGQKGEALHPTEPLK